MSDFLRSLRALESDDPRGSTFALVMVAIVLAVWGAWLVFGRVSLYEVSDVARLEVNRSVHSLESPVAGRVVASHLALDREVKAGEVLVELDVRAEQLALDEARARVTAIGPQIRALEGEIEAKRRSLDETEQGNLAALEEARADQREAESLAELAEKEAERAATLHQSGVISEAELNRKQTEAERLRAAARSRGTAVTRVGREVRAGASDRLADLQRLQRELDALHGEEQELRASSDRLAFEIERRRIRAPFDGRLGEIADLRIGQVIEEGETVGAVVPSGTLRAVAEFRPARALGRIRPGQPGRIRLAGFPWTEYGTVAVRVENVASEPRDAAVRVELAVEPTLDSRIPLQHGLPGAVEIEVERISPAALVLRAAGRMLAPRAGESDTRARAIAP